MFARRQMGCVTAEASASEPARTERGDGGPARERVGGTAGTKPPGPFIDRRRFLRLSTVGALPLAANVCARSARAPEEPVVVVGAGLAGLRAAELLHVAG